jgi:hypothetical protein
LGFCPKITTPKKGDILHFSPLPEPLAKNTQIYCGPKKRGSGMLIACFFGGDLRDARLVAGKNLPSISLALIDGILGKSG